MKNHISLGLGFLALAFPCLSFSCTTVTDTGRRQLNFMSPQEEAEQGFQAFEKIKQKRPISRDSAKQAAVRRVGNRIASVVKVPNARWEFVVFDDKTPNAFALPGGKVGVNSGIFPITRNDAGLATVVSHEIAHVVARHGAERQSQKTLHNAGSLALSLLGAGALGNIAGAGSQLGLLGFSRKHELEADQMGALYMARAGYDPREAVALWQRFDAYKQSSGRGGQPEFLSTHPVDGRRIQALQRFMPRALQDYRPR
ncbi:MAG: M48 family metallopeptidase [Verrucomicrobiota bacterium]